MKANQLSLVADRQQPSSPLRRWLDQAARYLVMGRLQQLEYGQLTLYDGDETHTFGQADAGCPFTASLYIKHQQAYSDIAFGGTIGAGEAYMADSWECDDLTALVRILLRNREVLDGMEGGSAYLTKPLHKLSHFLNRNSVEGSRRNINLHYDLGNAMFEQFLDPTMMYSCAVFEHEQATLQEASEAKLDRICRKLQLSAGDHLLEIGTGWGGLAIHAAKHYGCKVTTTTISQEQYDMARQRVSAEGLDGQVSLLLEDYRKLTGQYDKLVSIEMVEAVGHRYLDTYFKQCSDLLKADGMMLLQSITIDDRRYEIAKHEVDFIQRYIFPGGCLPSVASLAASIANSTDLRIFHLDDIGPHYATTLRKWRERFMLNLPKIRQLGYSDTFTRMWEFYLCYCEGGFEERAIGTVQVLLTKPQCRRESVLSVG